MNEFALELAKGVEFIALEKGLTMKEAIKSSLDILEKHKEKEKLIQHEQQKLYEEQKMCSQTYKRYYNSMFKEW